MAKWPSSRGPGSSLTEVCCVSLDKTLSQWLSSPRSMNGYLWIVKEIPAKPDKMLGNLRWTTIPIPGVGWVGVGKQHFYSLYVCVPLGPCVDFTFILLLKISPQNLWSWWQTLTRAQKDPLSTYWLLSSLLISQLIVDSRDQILVLSLFISSTKKLFISYSPKSRMRRCDKCIYVQSDQL